MAKKFLFLIASFVFVSNFSAIASGPNCTSGVRFGLRALSFSESARTEAARDNMPLVEEIIEVQPYFTEPAGAGARWSYFLSMPDEEYADFMATMMGDVDEIYMGVLEDMGAVEEFRKRYEAGVIAITGTPQGYKYNEKFGVVRDVRKEVSDLFKALRIQEDSEEDFRSANNFLQKIGRATSDDFDSAESFRTYVEENLRSAKVEHGNLEGVNWERLKDSSRKIIPWARFHANLKVFERDFIARFRQHGLTVDLETFQGAASRFGITGKGLAAAQKAAISGQGLNEQLYMAATSVDYNRFLSEIFWRLLTECKLRAEHFAGRQEYDEFTFFLFRYKNSRGEIVMPEESAASAARETQVLLNERYNVTGGNMLPMAVLELYGVPHPVVHWSADRDKFITRINDPLTHTLITARNLLTHGIKNGKCLRLAMLLHDISKKKVGLRLRGHYAVSARMVEGALNEWGLSECLSAEEKALVRLLVDTHAEFHSIKRGRSERSPLDIAGRLSPQRGEGYEILEGCISPETLLRMHRRITYADIVSIPGVVRQNIQPGQLNTAALLRQTNVDLIEGVLRVAHKRVITELLVQEADAALAGQPPSVCVAPIVEWLRGMNNPARRTFFRKTAGILSDMNISFSEIEDFILNNRLDSVLGENISAFVEPPVRSDVREFLRRAFERFVHSREDALPAMTLPDGSVFGVRPANEFYTCTENLVDRFAIGQKEMAFTDQLNANLKNAVESVLRGYFGPGITAVSVGSSQRETFVLGSGVADADFDFQVAIDKTTPWPDQQTLSVVIPKKIQQAVSGVREAGILSREYRLDRYYRLQTNFYEVRRIPDTYFVRVMCNNKPLVDVVITKNPDKGAVLYNEAFSRQLAMQHPDHVEDILRNIRMFRYFMRRVLKIDKGKPGSLGRADVIEQLVMQNGGTFTGAMEYVYEVSFNGGKRLMDFDTEIKPNLHLDSIVNPGGNLMYAVTKDEWVKLAQAAQNFDARRAQNTTWTLENLAGSPVIRIGGSLKASGGASRATAAARAIEASI